MSNFSNEPYFFPLSHDDSVSEKHRIKNVFDIFKKSLISGACYLSFFFLSFCHNLEIMLFFYVQIFFSNAFVFISTAFN